MKGGRIELVNALERGMVVLQSFSRVSTPMTLSEVARANGLSVATARRAVLTFEKMGYLARNGRRFVLREGSFTERRLPDRGAEAVPTVRGRDRPQTAGQRVDRGARQRIRHLGGIRVQSSNR
jgi:hypothetical protein